MMFEFSTSAAVCTNTLKPEAPPHSQATMPPSSGRVGALATGRAGISSDFDPSPELRLRLSPRRVRSNSWLPIARKRSIKPICFIAFAILFSFGSTEAVAQIYEQSPAAREAVQVIQGLRQRRLFELVDIYVAERMAAESMNELDKATVVLEAIQAKVTQTTSVTGESREQAFQQALAMATDFENSFPEHPRKLLVDLQVALAHLAHGNLIRQEIDAEMVPDENRTVALEQFRQATSLLRGIEKQIDKQLPIARNRSLAAGELTPDQLTNLKNGVRYRIATVNLAKAQLYDADDSLNRTDALNQVLSRLNDVTTNSNPSLPLWWEAQISRAKTYRLTGQRSQLETLFRQLPDTPPQQSLDVQVLTERILTSIQFEQPKSWPDLLNKSKTVKKATPNLQLSVLQLLMAQANRASASEKQQWQTSATEMVDQIERSHGRYWGRRAEILLVGSVQPTTGQPVAASEYGILVRQGDAAFRRKNFDDAIKAFSKAVSFATDAKDPQQALVMAVRLSQCHEQLQQHDQAAEKLFITSEQFPTNESAAQIHLRGCWNLLKSLGDKQDEAVSKLQTHIANWPDQESSNQTRLWLGNIYQKSGDWRLATKTYTEIESASPRIKEAIRFVGPSAEQWIRSQRDSGADWKASAREFASWISKKIGLSGSKPPALNGASAGLLAPMLDVGLPAGAVSASKAVEWLEVALANSGSQDLSNQLLVRLVYAKATLAVEQRSREDAVSELNETIGKLPADAQLLKGCLSRLKQDFSTHQLQSISGSVLLLCDRAMQDPKLKNREFWTIERAIAGTTQERSDSNINALKELAAKYPKSLRIQLTYARGLNELSDSQKTALQQWRIIAAQVESGSDSWLEAKYNVIRLMVETGQQAEAKKLAQFLSITSADWKKSQWLVKLQPLLREQE